MVDALSTLSMVEDYGLPLILLLGSIYALYRFMVFALYEVKNEFGAHHIKAKGRYARSKNLISGN